MLCIRSASLIDASFHDRARVPLRMCIRRWGFSLPCIAWSVPEEEREREEYGRELDKAKLRFLGT